VFARAREKARQSSCLCNLKQIGLALLAYTEDYDECLALSYGGLNGWDYSDAATRYKWMDAVQPYTKNEQVFNCPSGTELRYRYRSGQQYGHYGINTAYEAPGDAYTPPLSNALTGNVHLSAIRAPADTVWVADAARLRNGTDYYPWTIQWFYAGQEPTQATGEPPMLQRLCARHNSMANVLWCDGHVKAMTAMSLTQRNASGIYRQWTIEDD